MKFIIPVLLKKSYKYYYNTNIYLSFALPMANSVYSVPTLAGL